LHFSIFNLQCINLRVRILTATTAPPAALSLTRLRSFIRIGRRRRTTLATALILTTLASSTLTLPFNLHLRTRHDAKLTVCDDLLARLQTVINHGH
jgi:hypothetical protein